MLTDSTNIAVAQRQGLIELIQYSLYSWLQSIRFDLINYHSNFIGLFSSFV